METDDFINTQDDRYTRKVVGEKFDVSDHAMIKQEEEAQNAMLSLPVSREGADRIQNTNGEFVFMLGVDGLGEAPLG